VVETVSSGLRKVFGSRNERLLAQMWPVVEHINGLEEGVRRLSDEELRARTDQFRKRFANGESSDDILPEAFAVAREAADRRVGMFNVFNPKNGFEPEQFKDPRHRTLLEDGRQKISDGTPAHEILLPASFYDEIRELYPEYRPPFRMRPFDVQLIGGMVLHQGKIAEMATGEGKTLVATLATYLTALEGLSVHVVTVNDYLARRDMVWMGPMYEMLGLTVGCIQAHMDHEERQKAYGCNITYGTNNEFGFDYLRDNMKPARELQVQGELGFAIVDEVDSILVDEARTPLIISGPAEDQAQRYFDADRVARMLKEGRDYEMKLKEKLVLLTEEGMERAEKLAGVGSFYTSRNMDWPHLINQALQAHNFQKRDVDYIVKEGEVVIVDDFTGRLMPGRRWSDGLHQAIEAKEKLRIKEENQTLATITLQNYFKLYKRLSGMTGTAATEAEEFMKIYELDVVVIPTNKPLARTNHPDVIYRTEREKFDAIVNEICSVHRTGRPILVGTISIENSERLSDALGKRGVDHEVLNAKQHEREAQIVAKAGQLGNVTIATNMAGRGTDIVLGRFGLTDLFEFWKPFGLVSPEIDPEWPDERIEEALWSCWIEKELPPQERDGIDSLEKLKEKMREYWYYTRQEPMTFGRSVADLGGLHIVGTERHEARRIDNQLRGRAGRQGDPGSSRFYLSLQDDLMKRFASDWVSSILERLGMTEGQEIEHGMVTKSIERAQKRVEQYNFDIRKHLLEYDEVMNEQRKRIYKQRQQLLEGEDQRETVVGMVLDTVDDALEVYVGDELPPDGRDHKGLCEWLRTRLGVSVDTSEIFPMKSGQMREYVGEKVEKAYEKREKELGEDQMRTIERFLLLQTIDSKWKDHLYGMDYLKSGIGLRGYAQQDPKVAYKKEGYKMFYDMFAGIGTEVTEMIFRVSLEPEEETRSVFQVSGEGREEVTHVFDDAYDPSPPEVVEPIRREEPKVGRNEPCPCGSGKKYKKCCGRT
jgi:preprotein translocase subunit SecA